MVERRKKGPDRRARIRLTLRALVILVAVELVAILALAAQTRQNAHTSRLVTLNVLAECQRVQALRDQVNRNSIAVYEGLTLASQATDYRGAVSREFKKLARTITVQAGVKDCRHPPTRLPLTPLFQGGTNAERFGSRHSDGLSR